jgi:hypothetical protein
MNTAQELVFFEPYSLWYYPWWRNAYVVAAFWILCAALVIGALVYGAYRWFIKRKKAYWYTARTVLTQLNKRNLVTPEQIVAASCQLTALMKDYLSARFKKGYSAYTDHEMIAALNDESLTVEQKERLVALFSDNDPVKFAGQEASASRVKRDVQAALDIVDQTKPS